VATNTFFVRVTWPLVVFNQGQALAAVIFSGMILVRVTCTIFVWSVVSVVVVFPSTAIGKSWKSDNHENHSSR
jgi:hypothetical protein